MIDLIIQIRSHTHLMSCFNILYRDYYCLVYLNHTNTTFYVHLNVQNNYVFHLISFTTMHETQTQTHPYVLKIPANKMYYIIVKTQTKLKLKPKPNQYIYELRNEIQRRQLVNLLWLTIGRSCVCIEDTTADLFARRGEHNHNNIGAYELYSSTHPVGITI